MGGKTSTTTSSVSIPKEVLDRYNSVNAMAEKVANRKFKSYGNDPSAFVAQTNAQQQAGFDTINNSVGASQPYFQQAAQYAQQGSGTAQPGELQIDKYMSPYTQNVVDATAALIDQNNAAQMSGQTGNAIKSGSFGGDRAGIAAAVLAGQQGMARSKSLSDILQQGYTQALGTAQQQQGVNLAADQADLARKAQAAQSFAGLGQAATQSGIAAGEAQINAGTLQQQTEQAGKTALYQQFMQKQGYPFQVAQFLANIAMGTGALSGSTTQTTQPAPFFSDRRLKHDIKRIGKTDDGLPIYTFKYKGDHEEQTHIGFMAQDVEKVKPEAVGEYGGFKTVDYEKATAKAAGGGVDGPYASKVGSSPYMEAYVPEAYLSVGDLMMADPSHAANANKSEMSHLGELIESGKKLASLKDDFGKLTGKAEGGGIGSAPYLDVKKDEEDSNEGIGGAPKPQSYVSDTLDQQEKDTSSRNQLMEAKHAAPPPSGASQIGQAAGGIGSLLSGIAGIFALSDERVKHDIKRIGKTDDGMPIYTFKYDGDDRQRTHIGFMAQDVEKKHPDAVKEFGGFKHIDMSKAHKFARGGFAEGGYPEDEERKPTIADLQNALGPVANDNQADPFAKAAASLERYDAALAGMQKQQDARVAANNAPTFPGKDDAFSVPAQSLAAVSFPSQKDQPVTPSFSTVPVPEPRPAVDVAAPALAPARDITTPVVKEYSEKNISDVAVKPATPTIKYNTPDPDVSNYKTVEDRIREAAVQRGMDPDVVVNGFKSEGLGDGIWQSNVRKGNLREPSYGPFQLLVGDGKNFPKGMGNQFMEETGLDPRDPSTLTRQIDWTMDKLKQNGWDAWHGPKKLGYEKWTGIDHGSKPDTFSSVTRNVSDGLKEAGKEAKNTIGGMMEGLSELPSSINKALSIDSPNRNLILSILSGVGAMASSPSRYLGSAILQGVGAGANTYAGLQAQNTQMASQNIETLKKAAALTIQLNATGQNASLADVAKSIGYTGPIPENMTPEKILGTFEKTSGDSTLKSVDYSSFNEPSGSNRFGDGVTVANREDPQYLRAFIAKYSGIEDPIIRERVALAERRLAEIEASGYTRGVDANGNFVEVRAPEVIATRDRATTDAANREATIQFRKDAAEALPSISQKISDVDKQAAIFTDLEGGALTSKRAELAALFRTLGLGEYTPEMLSDPAKVQSAIKLAQTQMLSQLGQLPGGAPAAEMDALGKIVADPNLQPEALKMILSMQKAAYMRERDRMTMRTKGDWANSTDQLAYEEWFDKNKPFSEYYKAAYDSMPMFAGEPMKAPTGYDPSVWSKMSPEEKKQAIELEGATQ